ncbi:MAG: hypothetical protein ACR2O4_00145 [Hyphomicrobiaceae bacterium]
MGRIIAVLTGGLLGFTLAIMAAQAPTLRTPSASLIDAEDDEVYDAGSGGQRSPGFETDLARRPYSGRRDSQTDDAAKMQDRLSDPWPGHGDTKRSAKAARTSTGTALRPASELSRNSDIYRLQYQLARLDCFEGPMDGRWSPRFHERLAYVALTAELDLATLGNTDAVVEALQASDPLMCALPELTADGERPSLRAPVVAKRPAVRRKFARVRTHVDRHPEPLSRPGKRIAATRPSGDVSGKVTEHIVLVPTVGNNTRRHRIAEKDAKAKKLQIAAVQKDRGGALRKFPRIISVPVPRKAVRSKTGIQVAVLTDERAKLTDFSKLPLPVRKTVRSVRIRTVPRKPRQSRVSKAHKSESSTSPPVPRRLRIASQRKQSKWKRPIIRQDEFGMPVGTPWKENFKLIFPDR